MTRRTLVLIAALVAMVAALVVPTLTAGASRAHDIDPTKIDPSLLRVPDSVLPAGATVEFNGISDNADARNQNSNKLVVAHPGFYQGRITGYRITMAYSVNGAPARTTYIASIFDTAANAQAAMNETIPIITILGGTELPDPCPVHGCKAFGGNDPLDSTQQAIFGLFTNGTILVETASSIPTSSWPASRPAMEQILYAFLTAAATRVAIALGQITPTVGNTTATAGTAPTAAPTSAPTAVPTAVPTALPTAVPTKKPSCPKNSTKKKGKCQCKKGYVKKKGKCVKKK